MASSGLLPSGGISYSDANFYPVSNIFEYRINYPASTISDGTFVLNDVQYYAVRPENSGVTRIYFNEFAGTTLSSKVTYDVDSSGKFTIDGRDYYIVTEEVNGYSVVRIKVDATSIENNGDGDEVPSSG